MWEAINIIELEEKTILLAACEFFRLGTPLSRDGLREMAQNFFYYISNSRRSYVKFVDEGPGSGWVYEFIHRNASLSLRRRVNMK